VKYIKGTFLYGIKYQESNNGDIFQGYSYADWASDKDT
jgi:hypothetical protein